MATVDKRQIRSVQGFFYEPDISIFRLLLEASWSRAGRGDLLELGAFRGRSAVLMGQYLRRDEELIVVDLFGQPAPDEENRTEVEDQYHGLDRAEFERNYQSIHGVLPRVLQEPSSDILQHLAPGSIRFMHIDASHLYRHVATDMASARVLLLKDGVVAVDDFRAEHTPGVAAATWEAVACASLKPFLLTPQKLYATWGDAESWLAELQSLPRRRGWRFHKENVRDCDVIRVEAPYGHPVRQFVPPVAMGTLRRTRNRVLAIKNRS